MRGRRPAPADRPARPEPGRPGGSECSSLERHQDPASGGASRFDALPALFTLDFTSAGQSPDGGPALEDEKVHSPRPTSPADTPPTHYLGDGWQPATESATQHGGAIRAHVGAGLPLPRLRPPVARPALYCVVTPMDDRGRLADRSIVRAAGWPPGQPVTITAIGHRVMTVHAGGPYRITVHGHLRLPARARYTFHLSPGDRLLVTATTTPARLTVYPMATLDAILTQHPLAMESP